eukprot:gb/GEZN01008153.1/.p1 GENE.gb/GEZN01008153.1/~~gb/GEZN01008153.1/.p1  ORF type:complete len:477 (+),score=38.05 gb/GEZN01008153.1/:104-1432(+)
MTAFPLCIQLLKRIYDNREQCHVLQLAMSWLLAADLLLILNFGPHHLLSFASGRFIGGAYCYISGFWSMVMVVFSNVAAAGCAIVTNKSMGMQSRIYSSWFRLHYTKITAAMFVPGLIYGAILAGTSHVGNYRNLYCCMNDNGEAWVVWGGCAIFFICAMIQAHQYYSSYRYVKLQMESKSVHSNGEDQVARDRFVVGIRDHALRMASLFYIAWFPMMVSSIVSYSHGGLISDGVEAFPRGVDIFVVLCVKVVPLLDCLVIKRSLDKASINSNRKVNVHDSRGEQGSQAKSANRAAQPALANNNQARLTKESRGTMYSEQSHDSEPPADLQNERTPQTVDDEPTADKDGTLSDSQQHLVDDSLQSSSLPNLPMCSSPTDSPSRSIPGLPLLPGLHMEEGGYPSSPVQPIRALNVGKADVENGEADLRPSKLDDEPHDTLDIA